MKLPGEVLLKVMDDPVSACNRDQTFHYPDGRKSWCWFTIGPKPSVEMAKAHTVLTAFVEKLL